MQCRIPILIFPSEELGFRVHHLQIATPGVELDLAEQCDARTGREAVGEVSPVKPFAAEDRARRIDELRFEQSEVAAAKTGHLRGADLRDDSGQFPRSQL